MTTNRKNGRTPQGLWRATFKLGDAPALDMLDSLEELALSASIMETEADENEQTIAWNVDLLFEDKPDANTLSAAIGDILQPHDLDVPELKFSFLAHEDWLAKASMPRSTLELGRFVIHGHGRGADVPRNKTGILLEPGMAFGSGEHGSTSGCLLAFEDLLTRHRPEHVLDMGCGSAILAIAAARSLPARRGEAIVASDNDPIAVRVAAENACQNAVGHRIRTVLADGYDSALIHRSAPYDLVFANILADPLCAMAPGLRRHLARGGHAILAGLLDRQADTVIEAHVRTGLQLVGRLDLSPWTTLILRRPGPVTSRQT
ncbi:MAG: 50S ribosomal protein L11 methyltransferase [Geminicoccaceae bacterium]|nr:50S ribosomal protein L11 methyltransferase [Geminicoccaceae bacterium]MCB9945362.1 50S ribosomal protein L11 methyltransferase [Geminicoccaceae bacterium]